MNLDKNKMRKGLVGVGAVVFALLLVLGTNVHSVRAATSSFWDSVVSKTAEILAGKIEAPAPTMPEVTLGATERAPTYLAGTAQLGVTNRSDSQFLWGQQEVVGTSWLGNINATGTLNFSGLANGLGGLVSSFTAATTTVCAIQNTTGVDRVITDLALDISAGTSANTVNGSWRGYVSVARADNNTNVTGTLLLAQTINSSTVARSFGGPVPSSYYTSSTAFQTALSGVNTTTLIMWPANTWVNVTSSAITSSTGNCVVSSRNF